MGKPLDECSKEELVEIIKSQKETISRTKKFGLVWEDKPEKVATDCAKKLPVIKEVADRAIDKAGDSEPTNVIIEGDNYHALSVLNYTHAGKIDAIYADPPYNTGAKNWRYNNNYVDGQDAFRHSKWISFMDKRLRLARNLLKDTGIICVTIDDYEIAPLRLLMDSIFGDENYLGTAVIKNNPSGRSTTAGFSVSHEYGLFYSKTTQAKIGRLDRSEKQISRYKESDDKGNYEWVNFRARYTTSAPSMQYPIFIKNDLSDFRIPKLSFNIKEKKYELLEQPSEQETVIYPVDGNGVMRSWKWSIETINSTKETDATVRLDMTGKPAVYVKARMKQEGMLPLTWWDKTEYSATSQGTNLLATILGSKKFDYPKSIYAVEDSIKVLSDNKDALILDFFAGSGTTGHAVLELNKGDGGHRQFILCTNNENRIAEEVTYPRIRNVIDGYGTGDKHVEGIPANIRYFKTGFIDRNDTMDKLRRELSPACEDMIRVREGAYEKIIDDDMLKVFKNSRGLTAIIYDRFELAEHIEKIEALDTDAPVHLYVFSYSKSDRKDEMPNGLKHKYEAQPIPEGVLEIYKKIFANIKGGKNA